MPYDMPILHIIESDPVVRERLASLFHAPEIEIRTYADTAEFGAIGLDGEPGCVLLDAGMPEGVGLETYRELALLGSNLPVMFVAEGADVETAVAAMRMGAADFMEISDDRWRLIRRVREILRVNGEGQSVSGNRDTLTARESEILPHMMDGRSSKEIARELGISHRTVEVHRSNILRKLGASSVFELAGRRRPSEAPRPANDAHA